MSGVEDLRRPSFLAASQLSEDDELKYLNLDCLCALYVYTREKGSLTLERSPPLSTIFLFFHHSSVLWWTEKRTDVTQRKRGADTQTSNYKIDLFTICTINIVTVRLRNHEFLNLESSAEESFTNFFACVRILFTAASSTVLRRLLRRLATRWARFRAISWLIRFPELGAPSTLSGTKPTIFFLLLSYRCCHNGIIMVS